MLIAEIAGDRNSLNGTQVRGAVDFAARNNFRQHLDRNVEIFQYVPIPLEGVDVHQLCAAGIGHVGHVDAAVRPAGEMPDQKGIDIAKQKIAGFSLSACACNLFENPANFEATEISSERKASPGAIAVLSAKRSELDYRGSNSRILPDNRVVNGLPTFLVPDHSGFALVGDSDRSQIFRPQPASFHCFLDDTIRAPPNFFWIVLDPSRLGINLLVLFLSCAHDVSGTIEHYEARACRSLINGADIAWHLAFPPSCAGAPRRFSS